MKPRINLSKISAIEIEANTSDDGSRVYYTPSGPAPSVTTILSTLPQPELDAWRERVGEEEARRVSKEATTIGTHMHDMLEATLKDEEYPRTDCQYEVMAAEMAQAIRMFGWRSLREVWGIEIALHYENLYAGRTDLVGLYNRKPSIIDYKTTKSIKSPDKIVNYKLQIAAYSLAIKWMYDVDIEQGVLLFATRPNPEYRKPASSHIVVIDKVELTDFQNRWIGILEDFYR